jgi:hypothetical protein
VYSRISTRLPWFFDYIGEPEDDFVVELYGDVNFDGSVDVTDIVLMVGFVLNLSEPTEEEFLTADISQDGLLNIQDIIMVVQEVLGVSFRGAVEWLIENFPELEVERRLQELNKSIYFTK